MLKMVKQISKNPVVNQIIERYLSARVAKMMGKPIMECLMDKRLSQMDDDEDILPITGGKGLRNVPPGYLDGLDEDYEWLDDLDDDDLDEDDLDDDDLDEEDLEEEDLDDDETEDFWENDDLDDDEMFDMLKAILSELPSEYIEEYFPVSFPVDRMADAYQKIYTMVLSDEELEPDLIARYVLGALFANDTVFPDTEILSTHRVEPVPERNRVYYLLKKEEEEARQEGRGCYDFDLDECDFLSKTEKKELKKSLGRNAVPSAFYLLSYVEDFYNYDELLLGGAEYERLDEMTEEELVSSGLAKAYGIEPGEWGGEDEELDGEDPEDDAGDAGVLRFSDSEDSNLFRFEQYRKKKEGKKP